MRIAVFPGSFDPVRSWHQDMMGRTSKIFYRVDFSMLPK